MNNSYSFKFHGCMDRSLFPYTIKEIRTREFPNRELLFRKITTEYRDLTYRFYPHFHPFVSALLRKLIQGSVRGLQAADTELSEATQLELSEDPDMKLTPDMYKLYVEFFDEYYNPGDTVSDLYPVHNLDFTSNGAYSVYNWEIFYHIPITMAIHLSKSGRFQEAQKWFHLTFDPTDDSIGPTPERFWKVKPFQCSEFQRIEGILTNLSTCADPDLRRNTIDSIMAWKDAPFRPHVIARYRQSAYMLKTVMAYLDNLVAWGDTLFRRDTGESINEATMLYVLAANILGLRPQPVPSRSSIESKCYNDLRSDLDELGNAMIELENDLIGDTEDLPFPTDVEDDGRFITISSLGRSLYFCVPKNDMILEYWDTVADRLYKIRNSLNIQGVFRQLPLFEPPIDPALLARAAAAGLDVSAIMTGLNQPLPLIRFRSLLQKAFEICQEVKSLGSGLLSAIEKEDAEKLGIRRAEYESVILNMVEKVKYAQWQEVLKNEEGLLLSLQNSFQKYVYFERLLGKDSSEIELPEFEAMDTDSMDRLKFRSEEPSIGLREIDVDIAGDSIRGGSKLLSSYEKKEMNVLEISQIINDAATVLDLTGAVLNLIPEGKANAQPMGVGLTIGTGGTKLGDMFKGLASGTRGVSSRSMHEASRSGKMGTYQRREQEWTNQSNLVAGEITSIYKQFRAAQIRSYIAQKELENHRKQMKHAEEIEYFLKEEKTANKDFYTWMRREVKGLFDKCYKFAFDIAKKAERALQHELGDTSLSYLQFGYSAGKEGLLAGEKLWFDVKQMEIAYFDLNKREFEMTKHVSLSEVDPLALLTLRATGSCEVILPEELFDMDCPGHYFRRIKSVGVSIPCVTGPYSGINCTLTLQKSSIRKNPLVNGMDYKRESTEDNRFSDYYGSVQSIVTSSGQNDSGMFDTNLNDERYLPFEGSGAESTWLIELPSEIKKFDYDTISDVIINIRYTARQGGTRLRQAAEGYLKTLIEKSEAVGCVRLFSVRHDFPATWHRFKSTEPATTDGYSELKLEFSEKHFPYWSRAFTPIEIKECEIFAKPIGGTPTDIKVRSRCNENDPVDLLTENEIEGLISCEIIKIDKPEFMKPYSLYLEDNSLEDIWIKLVWGA